jgi:xanthine dehydrogenase accessory factor
MREIIPELRRWRAAGKADLALATILETRGSSLRSPGTRMALTSEGDVAGSVSSGCVDGDVIAEMEAVLKAGLSIRRPSYGISDEQAWAVGLSCGGAIDILVERWSEIYESLIDEIEAKRPVGFASRVDRADRNPPSHLLHRADGTTQGTLGEPDLDDQVLRDVAAAWPGPYAQRHTYPLRGKAAQAEVFLEVIPPPPVLVIFGATDIGVVLSRIAAASGFEVIVNDARRVFAKAERFPEAKLRFGWPQDALKPQDLGPSTAAVVLFHDPKFDIPALTLALHSDAFYIGFLGSRNTQADRRAELLRAGFKESDLGRIYGPVGLDIGGKTPAYIALSIMAEVVAVLHRKKGSMLGDHSVVDCRQPSA